MTNDDDEPTTIGYAWIRLSLFVFVFGMAILLMLLAAR